MKAKVVLPDGSQMVINTLPRVIRRFRAKGLDVVILPDLRPFLPDAFDARFPRASA